MDFMSDFQYNILINFLLSPSVFVINIFTFLKTLNSKIEKYWQACRESRNGNRALFALY